MEFHVIHLDKYILFLTLQKFCYSGIWGKKNLFLANHVRESILPGSSLLRSEKKKGSLRSLANKGLTSAKQCELVRFKRSSFTYSLRPWNTLYVGTDTITHVYTHCHHLTVWVPSITMQLANSSLPEQLQAIEWKFYYKKKKLNLFLLFTNSNKRNEGNSQDSQWTQWKNMLTTLLPHLSPQIAQTFCV